MNGIGYSCDGYAVLSVFDPATVEAARAGLPRVRPSCAAGSVVFLDRFTPHRGLPVGGDARFALVVWMKAA